MTGAGFAKSRIVAEPRYLYSAADQAVDGLAGTLQIEIVQIGTAATSRPAFLAFDAGEPT